MRYKALASIVLGVLMASAVVADPPKRGGNATTKKGSTTQPANDGKLAAANFQYLRRGLTQDDVNKLFDRQFMVDSKRSSRGTRVKYEWTYDAGATFGIYTVRLAYGEDGGLIEFDEASRIPNR